MPVRCASGGRETERIALPGVHRPDLPRPPAGTWARARSTATACTGPYEPEAGHRFNPNKLLLDPYALAHAGALSWDPACFGYQMESGDDLTFDERDSAPFMPKCVVVDPELRLAGRAGQASRALGPHHRLRSACARLHRACAAMSPSICAAPMPASASAAGDRLHPRRSASPPSSCCRSTLSSTTSICWRRACTNYWGYNSIGFFAPDPRYAADHLNTLREFKEMVARFHEAGLEVILDVVYNHTAEGNERGPTLSFKGIDNASYYRLLPDQKRYYINDTGTGNTVNLSHPRVIQMVTDCLRYWAQEMHVDGFRFDLGTILAREPNGFDNQSGFLKAVTPGSGAGQREADRRALGLRPRRLPGRRLPARLGGMERPVPRHRARLLERRSASRRRWRRGCAPRPTSSIIRARRPWASVNFITAHDGFTLNDLVSYNDKHNEANGEDNRDGSNDNRSWNCGAEGPTDDAGDPARCARARCATCWRRCCCRKARRCCSPATNSRRTQHGNNNAYCQDNEISWVDWNDRRAQRRRLHEFVRLLTGLRASLSDPAPQPLSDRSLRRGIRRQGRHLDQCLRARRCSRRTGTRRHAVLRHAHGRQRSQAQGLRERGTDATLLIVFNSHHEPVDLALPPCNGARGWRLLIDTELERAEARGVRNRRPLLYSGTARCWYSSCCRNPHEHRCASPGHAPAQHAVWCRAACRRRALSPLGAEA